MRHLATVLGVMIAIAIGATYAACSNPPTTAQDQKAIDTLKACLKAAASRNVADSGVP